MGEVETKAFGAVVDPIGKSLSLRVVQLDVSHVHDRVLAVDKSALARRALVLSLLPLRAPAAFWVVEH